MSNQLEIMPIRFKEACFFIAQYHRHHKPPIGHLFSVSVSKNNTIVGVAVVGRPVSRLLDNGLTAEVTRLCTDGTKNACSILYASCWRAVKAMGYKKLITYILASESGCSLTASGYKCLGLCGGGSWSRKSRPRIDTNPTQLKLKFERSS